MMLSTSHLSGLLLLSSISLAVAQNGTVWDYAPDFSSDPIPPYPSLKNPDGTNISIESVRGTHLFGWKGCSNEEANVISQAYNDFFTLAQQPEVYNNIGWDTPAATDFWGPASGPNVVPDDTRKEIQQIFAAAQQVYSYSWTWQPPWLSWRQLWIEIRCSDSKSGPDSSDPTNSCGDYKDPKKCPDDDQKKLVVEAFSDPHPTDSKYSRITFCNGFFNLETFKNAMDAGNKLPASQKTNLAMWNNQARCFFHEITHLDYFMNSGAGTDALSPFVSDLKVKYAVDGVLEWHSCYGPYDAKILRNWVDPNPQYSGYFTQRNADSYAFFALANYVESQINQYPNSPSPGRKKPTEEPRDAQTDEPPLIEQVGTQGQDVDLIDGDEQDPDNTTVSISNSNCGSDKISTDDPVAVYIDQGNLNCRGIHPDGDPGFYFNMGGAISAIQNFCDSAISTKVIIGGDGGQDLYEVAEDDGYGQDLDISAEWEQGSDCPGPMDFTRYDAGTLCQERLTNVIDNCDTFVRNSTNWKQGGTFFRDCITWKCIIATAGG